MAHRPTLWDRFLLLAARHHAEYVYRKFTEATAHATAVQQRVLLAKIRRNWRIPEIARLGVQGVAKLRFFIERDGTVTGLQIVDESGKPPMDFAARDAIAFSSPFEPLPSDLSGVEREGVTITFFYNTRPPDWDGH